MMHDSFDDLPLFAPRPDEPRRSKLERAFWQFHADHPEVYQILVRLALEARARHPRKLGIKALFERARWEIPIPKDKEEFKLNNNHTAYYARYIMTVEPGLQGAFDLRQQRQQATIGPKNSELPAGLHVA
jgi:hypothetical protein